MNCPKCGYEQEERLDCVRCGIVFSKYLALFPKGKAGEAMESRTRPMVAEDVPDLEISQISQQVRDLSRRFNDIEFERAERTRLRGEMKVFEQELHEKLGELGRRIEKIEANRTGGVDLEPLVNRIELLEVGLRTPPPAASVLKSLEEMNSRLTEMEITGKNASGELSSDGLATENQLEEFVSELGVLQSTVEEMKERFDGSHGAVAEVRSALDVLREDIAAMKEPAADPFPKLDHLAAELERLRASVLNLTTRYGDVAELKKGHAALTASVATFGRSPQGAAPAAGQIEDLRKSLENVSVRYSEIGQLKKNDLVQQSSLESLGREIAALRDSVSRGYLQRIEDLGKEVGALRAEVRQLLGQPSPTDKPRPD
jgi:DNA repair exonuclease SbcCD ATPase subunit